MPTFSFLQPAVWFCPITEGRRLKMNTSGWGLREDNVCRDSSDRYWPKGRKADGISLTYGKLHSVTQPDQCPLSLSFFLRLHLWGTFNAQTCSGWNREGGGAPENVDRCMRKCSEAPQDCWLHRLICEIEGWQAKVSAAVVYSSSDFRGNVRNREILWCGRYCTDAAYASPALRDILYSCSGCAAFMFCDQGQRLKISD